MEAIKPIATEHLVSVKQTDNLDCISIVGFRVDQNLKHQDRDQVNITYECGYLDQGKLINVTRDELQLTGEDATTFLNTGNLLSTIEKCSLDELDKRGIVAKP